MDRLSDSNRLHPWKDYTQNRKKLFVIPTQTDIDEAYARWNGEIVQLKAEIEGTKETVTVNDGAFDGWRFRGRTANSNPHPIGVARVI